jgi:hypothetical protein
VKKPTTKRSSGTNWARIDALKDREIDTSDILEQHDYIHNWKFFLLILKENFIFANIGHKVALRASRESSLFNGWEAETLFEPNRTKKGEAHERFV